LLPRSAVRDAASVARARAGADDLRRRRRRWRRRRRARPDGRPSRRERRYARHRAPCCERRRRPRQLPERRGERRGERERERPPPAGDRPAPSRAAAGARWREAQTVRRELALALGLLEREDDVRITLFGGGFGRDALIGLCRMRLLASGGDDL